MKVRRNLLSLIKFCTAFPFPPRSSQLCKQPLPPHRSSSPNLPKRPRFGIPAHLWSQDVEVPGSIRSADQLTLVARRHSGILGDPRDCGREPVCAVVVAIESLTLFFPKALPRDCMKTNSCSYKKRRNNPLGLIHTCKQVIRLCHHVATLH